MSIYVSPVRVGSRSIERSEIQLLVTSRQQAFPSPKIKILFPVGFEPTTFASRYDGRHINTEVINIRTTPT